MQQARYHISKSYNEVTKRDMFLVRDKNGGATRSTHETQLEAEAAMNKYIADDERKAGDAQ